MRKNRGNLIRASEIAEYVYCARAWKLRLDGHNPTTGQVARVAGEEFHQRHGRSVRRARRLNAIAYTCFVLAIIAALILLLRWSR
jgi:hypothetical protein